MNHKYDNSERLETVSDKQWREALDELTAYLRWRLKGVIGNFACTFFGKGKWTFFRKVKCTS